MQRHSSLFPTYLGMTGLLVAGLMLPVAVSGEAPLPRVTDFNRDVRPILSDNCYACHGPDKNKRKAALRLDTREGLFRVKAGKANIVPGKPTQSELFRLLTTEDRDERMPDPKSGKSLKPREIAVIRLWIEQGAAWKGHWAYVPPVRPQLPAIEDPGFVHNSIDRFILAKLQEAKLTPAPEASRVTLIRRLSFDILGLPPTSAEVDAFVGDSSPDAYVKLVERLLTSAHHGERLAMYWLDLVRYADTIGYHSDNPMNVWPYRDYVIRSFANNKRFDQFTIEQLAGDLLPDATLEQKVASGYNRLLQTTEEGGAQAKEYEAKYAADRVRNATSVWLGATMGCCQCHDHKFDPYSTKDFYRLAAFFADVQEASVGKREPGMPVPSAADEIAIHRLDQAIAAAQKKLDEAANAVAATTPDKRVTAEPQWRPLVPESFKVQGESHLQPQLDGSLKTVGKVAATESYVLTYSIVSSAVSGIHIEALADDLFPARGPGTAPNGNFVLTEIKATVAQGKAAARPLKFQRAVADHAQDGYPVMNAIDGRDDTGWAILPAVGKRHEAVFELAEKIKPMKDTHLTLTLEFKSPFPQHQIGRLRISATDQAEPATRWLPPDLRAALASAAAKRTPEQRQRLRAYFLETDPRFKAQREEMLALQRQKTDLLNRLPTCLVAMAGPPRTTRVLTRGNWMDDSGQVVIPGVPHFLFQPKIAAPRATRLDLARWIVSRDNPLTARVLTNRLWKLYFGQGIARSLEDLGSQGEWPTHPELLDWLAVEFMESGWDVRHMIRLLVASSAYRRSSVPTAEQKERDPYNRLYARQSRWRLDAEMVRDNALAVSGLLNPTIGGPSVKPYQPAGYWTALNFPPREWQNDTGTNLYRRGLYTHWQRSFLHPSLLAFDTPSREECIVERPRSNIPQQALALLNDPTYVEAARVLAGRIIKEGGKSDSDRLGWVFGRVLSRSPRGEELNTLTQLKTKHAREFAADKQGVLKLFQVGASAPPRDADAAELAAWTSVARVILNLHETITRE